MRIFHDRMIRRFRAANCKAILAVLICLWLDTPVVALIVTPPAPSPVGLAPCNNKLQNRIPNPDQQNNDDVAVARIRSMRRDDVDSVADLLSMAFISAAVSDQDNFKTRMERLRAKSFLRTTLDVRVKTIQEAKRYLLQASKVKNDFSAKRMELLKIQQLWSKDSFILKVLMSLKKLDWPC